MSEKSSFRRPFNRQHGKRAETLLKSEGQHLYHIYWSLSKQVSWEKSLLVISKTLTLLVKILTAYDKYMPLNRDNLTLPIRMQLSQN